jgi:hypothetical protein
MALIRQKMGKLANAAVAIFALGCISVFFMVGKIGGFEISKLVGVVILAIFVFGVCAAPSTSSSFWLLAELPVSTKTSPPLRGGEWWRR